MSPLAVACLLTAFALYFASFLAYGLVTGNMHSIRLLPAPYRTRPGLWWWHFLVNGIWFVVFVLAAIHYWGRT